MDRRRGVRRAVTGLLAVAVVASLRVGGGGAAAEPGFTTTTLVNPAFKGANTEPSLRVARDGTAYVGAIRGFPKGVDLWRLGAGGGPAAYLGSPDSAVPAPCCAGLGGGDMDLAIADDGTVAYTSLWLGSLTVGRSTDGGRTFVSQPLGSPVVGDDRPWLATDGHSFYLSFHDILTGNIDIVRSAAGPQAGLAYTPMTPVLSPADAAVGNNQLGDLLADRRHPGVLHQVYTTSADASLGLNGGPGAGQNVVRMATSTDGGGSWVQHTVLTGPAASGYASVFPAAALDATGALYVAVSDNAHVLVLSSSDRGVTWRGPVRVDPGIGAVVFPWVAAGGDGGVVVSWLGSRVTGPDAPDASWQVYAAETLSGAAAAPAYRLFTVSDRVVHARGICQQGLGCRSGRELGDFFQVAVGPDGLAGLAWADDGLGGPAVVRFARGGLTLGPPN
ncbi:MAG TPA: sialidase family protein [Candidatus Dormibacteraeota bacterium]|jgi:hypothetical protein